MLFQILQIPIYSWKSVWNIISVNNGLLLIACTPMIYSTYHLYKPNTTPIMYNFD